MEHISEVKWIAVDWGVSYLRVYAINDDGDIIDKRANGNGMANLLSHEYEGKLLELVADWLGYDRVMPIMACGMVGSKQGWVDVPYNYLPNDSLIGDIVSPITDDNRIKVFIIPGVAQLNPCDVMRGEETLIAGYLSTDNNFDGVICLPGTHCKWVKVEQGKVKRFKTAMTGEVFKLITEQSILRHSIFKSSIDLETFYHALDIIRVDTVDIFGKLFSLRAEELLKPELGTDVYSKLSGYLIGIDILDEKELLRSTDIVFIGEEKLSNIYKLACIHLKVCNEERTKIVETIEIIVAGLKVIYENKIKNT